MFIRCHLQISCKLFPYAPRIHEINIHFMENNKYFAFQISSRHVNMCLHNSWFIIYLHLLGNGTANSGNNIFTIHWAKSADSRLMVLVVYHYKNTPIQIYWKFYHQKLKFFRWKNSDIIHISTQNIDYRYSNEYPQSMFLSRSKKIIYTPVNPSFAI